MPRVSVITRTKNRPLTLKRVVASLAAQDFKDFEWIIVNDGGDKAVAEQIGKSATDLGLSVEIIHREQSTGMEAASNAGIRAARSSIIALLDDDDTWEAEFLGVMSRFLDQNPRYLAVTCRTQIVIETISGDEITRLKAINFNPMLRAVHIVEVLKKAIFTNNALVFRRPVWDAVGGFDESLLVTGDWDFTVRLLRLGDIGVVPRVLANYHKRLDESMDSTYGNSIIAGIGVHHEYNAILRNKWLRQDLDAGVAGIGTLFGLMRQFELASTHERNMAIVEDIMNALTANGVTRTLIFGAGEIGQLLLTLCRDSGIDCPALIDNSRPMQGTMVDHTPILAPDVAPSLGCPVVTIGSQAFIDDIHRQIRGIFDAAGLPIAVYAIRPAARLDPR